MRLDSYSADVVDAVSFACGESPALAVVWLHDGLAFATDAYRMDLRCVDTDASGIVYPTRPDVLHRRWPSGWDVRNLGERWFDNGISRIGQWRPFRPRFNETTDDYFCSRCGKSETPKPYAWFEQCDCPAPVLNVRFYRQAVAHIDDPKTVRWGRGPRCYDPLRLQEPEHWHWIMPVTRKGGNR